MLIGVHLKNYGVLHDTPLGLLLKDLRSGHLPDEAQGIISIRPLSALIGRNSTGKSSLFDALSFLADCLRHGVQYAATLNDRGGFSKLLTAGNCRKIMYDLLIYMEKGDYYLNYALTIACDGHGRPHIAAEQVIRAEIGAAGFKEQNLLEIVEGQGQIFDNGMIKAAGVADKVFPALAAYGALLAYPELQALFGQITHWYFCQYSQPFPDQQRQRSTGGHKHLNAGCDNIDNVLTYYRKEQPREYQRIMQRINELIADGQSVEDEFRQGKITSGSLKLFAFLLLLSDPRPRPLICLEEPDAGLYHDSVDKLALEMREYTLQNQGCQILFTTHSPYILESMRPDEVWVFERREAFAQDTQTDHYAKARCVGADPLVKAMYEQGVGMGALWYGGHFDQHQEE